LQWSFTAVSAQDFWFDGASPNHSATPEGPSSVKNSPGATSRSMASTAVKSP
jgi:hypothetical protein